MITGIYTLLREQNGLTKSINVSYELTIFSLFLTLVFYPIIEEFVFRKILAKKMVGHGNTFYVLTSSFCFALVHIVSQGAASLIMIFLLGVLLSVVYLKTGKIIFPIMLHSFSNLIIFLVPKTLSNFSELYLVIYAGIIFVTGMVYLFRLVRKIKKYEGLKVSLKEAMKDILTNKGMLIFFVLTIFTSVLQQILCL